METLPQVSITSGHGFAGKADWRAGIGGGLSAHCCQDTDPRSSSELFPGALALCDSTCTPGFLPRSLAATFNTYVLCSRCVLAERVDFLLDVRVEQLFPMAVFPATAGINDTFPALSHQAAFTFA